MKKIICMFLVLCMCSACEFNKDPYDGAKIYSTVYPITYLMEKLYGEYSTIDSIYPVDANILEYKLTDKQINNYSGDSEIFVYLGLTDEKNIAKEFVNENKELLLVDATIGLSVANSVEELWLSPNNYLMLAKNIRDNLFEALDNQYILEKVDVNYEAVKERLSVMDADLRNVGNSAKENGNNVIVATSDAFLYLENYGFTVISLESESNQSDEAINAIKSNFENSRYLALVNEYGSSNELVNSFINDYKAPVINMNSFYSSDDSINYLEAMNDFIIHLDLLVK